MSANTDSLTDAELVDLFVRAGMARSAAVFMAALDRGQTNGDIVAVDEDGNEVNDPEKRNNTL